MADIRNMLNASKNLKTADLKGGAVTVIVESVSVEKVGSDDDVEKRPVMRFQGKDRGLVLNKTRGLKAAEIFGSNDSDTWVGRSITIYTGTTSYGGETVPCMALRAPGGMPQSAPPPPPVAAQPDELTVDDIPF